MRCRPRPSPRPKGSPTRPSLAAGCRLDGSAACTSSLPPLWGWSPKRRTEGEEMDSFAAQKRERPARGWRRQRMPDKLHRKRRERRPATPRGRAARMTRRGSLRESLDGAAAGARTRGRKRWDSADSTAAGAAALPIRRRPPLVRDQTFARELALRLVERDVAGRQDHVGLDQLVPRQRVAVGRHELEHLGPELAKAGLVALLDGVDGAVV